MDHAEIRRELAGALFNLRTDRRRAARMAQISPVPSHERLTRVPFRARQPRNHCGKFIEYLVPALYLTAILSVLHGLISNECKSGLAVSKILKGSHIVRIGDGLMLYSIVRRLNPVSLGVGKVHGGNDLLVQNNLVVFTTIPELLAIRRSHDLTGIFCTR